MFEKIRQFEKALGIEPVHFNYFGQDPKVRVAALKSYLLSLKEKAKEKGLDEADVLGQN